MESRYDLFEHCGFELLDARHEVNPCAARQQI